MSYKNLAKWAAAFLRDQSGPTATEYAVMLALIVLVAMGSIAGIGGSIQGLYDRINTTVPNM